MRSGTSRRSPQAPQRGGRLASRGGKITSTFEIANAPAMRRGRSPCPPAHADHALVGSASRYAKSAAQCRNLRCGLAITLSISPSVHPVLIFASIQTSD
jgi:hypothetical protein